MGTAGGTLRFTLARTVNLVAVSSGPRPAGPEALPEHVRLVDLATAGELAELAAALEARAAAVTVEEGAAADGPAGPPPVDAPAADPGGLDGLIARAEARLVAIRSGSGRDRAGGPHHA